MNMTDRAQNTKPGPLSSERTYYSADEFGAVTGFSGYTIRRFCRDGILEHIRLGKNIRIPVTQLDRLSKGGRRNAN